MPANNNTVLSSPTIGAMDDSSPAAGGSPPPALVSDIDPNLNVLPVLIGASAHTAMDETLAPTPALAASAITLCPYKHFGCPWSSACSGPAPGSSSHGKSSPTDLLTQHLQDVAVGHTVMMVRGLTEQQKSHRAELLKLEQSQEEMQRTLRQEIETEANKRRALTKKVNSIAARLMGGSNSSSAPPSHMDSNPSPCKVSARSGATGMPRAQSFRTLRSNSSSASQFSPASTAAGDHSHPQQFHHRNSNGSSGSSGWNGQQVHHQQQQQQQHAPDQHGSTNNNSNNSSSCVNSGVVSRQSSSGALEKEFVRYATISSAAGSVDSRASTPSNASGSVSTLIHSTMSTCNDDAASESTYGSRDRTGSNDKYGSAMADVEASATQLCVVGGFDGKRYLASGEAYDSGRGAWVPLPPVAMPVQYPALAPLGDQLVMLGGYNGTKQVRSMHALDLGVGRRGVQQWDGLPEPPTPATNYSTASLDGKMYAINGVSSQFVCYCPATRAWTRKADMLNIRQGGSLVVCKGLLYAIGGARPIPPSSGASTASGESEAPTYEYSRTIECYDPRVDEWVELKDRESLMRTRKVGFAAVVDEDQGRVFVFGGYSEGKCIDKAVCLVITPRDTPAAGAATTGNGRRHRALSLFHKWYAMPALPGPRSGMVGGWVRVGGQEGSGAHSNLRVLIAGGYDSVNYLKTAVFFNPFTQTYAPAPPMSHARFYAAAVSFPDRGAALRIASMHHRRRLSQQQQQQRQQQQQHYQHQQQQQQQQHRQQGMQRSSSVRRPQPSTVARTLTSPDLLSLSGLGGSRDMQASDAGEPTVGSARLFRSRANSSGRMDQMPPRPVSARPNRRSRGARYSPLHRPPSPAHSSHSSQSTQQYHHSHQQQQQQQQYNRRNSTESGGNVVVGRDDLRQIIRSRRNSRSESPSPQVLEGTPVKSNDMTAAVRASQSRTPPFHSHSSSSMSTPHQRPSSSGNGSVSTPGSQANAAAINHDRHASGSSHGSLAWSDTSGVNNSFGDTTHSNADTSNILINNNNNSSNNNNNYGAAPGAEGLMVQQGGDNGTGLGLGPSGFQSTFGPGSSDAAVVGPSGGTHAGEDMVLGSPVHSTHLDGEETNSAFRVVMSSSSVLP